MDAHQVCELLILKVKSSELNYILEESPFSVNIRLKKSFIKKKNGESLNCANFNRSNLVDEAAEKKSFDKEREALEETISDLSDKLEKSKVEICELLSENNDKTKVIVLLEKELVKAKDFSDRLKIENTAVEEKHDSNLKTINIKNNEIKELEKKVAALEEEVSNLENQNSELQKDLEDKISESQSITTKSCSTSITRPIYSLHTYIH